MSEISTPILTLGPLYYHWPAEEKRDFYFRIADEAPLDEVYLGEVICSKREVLFDPYVDQVVGRLEKAGKRVHSSSLALMTQDKQRAALEMTAQKNRLIEANDIAAVKILEGRDFIIGPYLTVLNEGSLAYLASLGAKRIVFASEMSGAAMAKLAAAFPDVEKEAQIFGRQPLAIAMRCYSARAQGRDKDHCRFACGEERDGLPVSTLDGEPVLTVNGTQTLSSGTLVLADELSEMRAAGITHFRLCPQRIDMVAVAGIYRNFLDGQIDPELLRQKLAELDNSMSYINGFYHGREGRQFCG